MSGCKGTVLGLGLLIGSVFGASAQDPVKGGTLTYTFHPEPSALSTLSTTAVPVAIISTKIYESLLNWEGAAMAPKPGLATSWTISDDGLTYTFKLREGVKWHDGQPLTAADVKFTVESIVGPYHSRGRAHFGDLSGIETPDDLTVIFKLNAPVPYFIKAFQPSETPILPKHKFEGVDLKQAAAVRQAEIFTKQPVGTGPFKLKEWQRGSHIILERNPGYWKSGHPYLDQVILRVLPDGSARAIAVEKGEVDLAPQNGLPEAEIQRLAALPSLQVSSDGAEALGPILWLEVNLREGPMADVRVRKAISMALDRSRIIDVIWYGYGKAATGPIVSANPALFNTSMKPLAYDPKKAAALLDEAGFKPGADGLRFKIVQHYLPYGENYVRLAEYVKQELQKIGIGVETKSLDLAGWLKTVYTDWGFNLTSTFSHNYSDPSIGVERTFTSSNIKKGASFTNSMGYSNPKVDELFKAASREMDAGKRKNQFLEIQSILNDELPVIFLIEMQYVHVWNKKVNGLIQNGISMYSNWDSVWKAK